MKRRLVSLFFAAAIALAVIAVDWLGRGESPLAEGPPVLDWTHALRTLLFAGASWLAVNAFRPCAGRGPADAAPGRWAWRGVCGALALSAACVGLFVANPGAFNRLSLEDAPVESLSALLLFLTSILLFVVAFGLRRTARPARYGTIGLAVFVLLIGLEEVSWFQRALSIETPRVFAENNWENEINLHNFATDFSEDAYYSAIFVLLVLLPFAARGSVIDRPVVRFFTPGPRAQDLAAIPVAYNYDMWNEPAMQLAFFVTVFILLCRARDATDSRTRFLIAFVAVSVVTSQIVFLGLGRKFLREWDVTEYKEMFIPLALLGYALELYCRARGVSQELAPTRGQA